ncbi:MAG: hypothetical protein CVV63_00370 [Tenericutes bacterium HGW-Tenericutes-8]|nr:MAG: hypothetical protein CVV63_00370 [Tenericutes bacterium HGW-Tenericutes-8]PKK96931.1 MAG: hypothetical protein CVV58_03845 [Tenericutes bacterium HGW-Tenericutes-3]
MLNKKGGSKMKKVWMVLLLVASFGILASCTEAEEVIDEGPDSIDILVNGLQGEGTLESPYILEINLGETIEKHVSITGDYDSLEYLFGTVEDGKFVVDETTKNIHFNERSTDEYLSVVGETRGESMLRIKGKDMSSSAYVAVNTISRDGLTDNVKDYNQSLKILAIGNSFSEDAMTYLGEIFADYGMDHVVLSYLYIGGASLETHWNAVSNGTSSYRYEKNVDNDWENKGNKSLLIGLLDEEWDVITMQQASGKSGLPDTYQPFLDDLVNYVTENKLTDTTFMWHQTWAYSQSSTHSEFPNYGRDQITMYEAIINANQNLILNHESFRQIIPAGTALQNVRTSSVGDNVTRDGYHLNVYGRYVAALMWFRTITGFSIDDITYKPSTVTDQQLLIAKEAVNNAYQQMFETTASIYQ